MKVIAVLICISLFLFAGQTAYSQNNDVEIIEDFEGIEFIPINVMSNGWIEQDDDVESFEVVENPDPSDVNSSDYVLKFTRAYDGDPWAGFWSELPEPIDMTDKKYIHFQVWKPRVSPVRFKVEGGETDDIEINPIEPQEATEEWVNLTFDFGAEGATGEYPIIALMPDFEDPLELEDDITLYIDNIILSESDEVPVSVEPVPDEVASDFELRQNYPNPFNPATQIQYTIPENANVTLEVYNMLGQKVDMLVDEHQTAGTYEATFDGTNLSSGTYIYRLRAGEFSQSRTMMLVK